MEAIEIEQAGPFRIEIHLDSEPGIDPIREDDSPFHLNLNFGRYGDLRTPDCEDEKDLNETLERLGDSCWKYPVFAYIHSGTTIRMADANPFYCGWDSGCCGMVFADKSEFETESLARAACDSFVQLGDDMLTGSVYGYQVFGPDDDKHDIDSCWGFFGDAGKQDALEEARLFCQNQLATREDHLNATFASD